MENILIPGRKAQGRFPLPDLLATFCRSKTAFIKFKVRFYGSGVIVAAVVALLASLGRGRWVIGLDNRFPSNDFC